MKFLEKSKTQSVEKYFFSMICIFTFIFVCTLIFEKIKLARFLNEYVATVLVPSPNGEIIVGKGYLSNDDNHVDIIIYNAGWWPAPRVIMGRAEGRDNFLFSWDASNRLTIGIPGKISFSDAAPIVNGSVVNFVVFDVDAKNYRATETEGVISTIAKYSSTPNKQSFILKNIKNTQCRIDLYSKNSFGNNFFHLYITALAGAGYINVNVIGRPANEFDVISPTLTMANLDIPNLNKKVLQNQIQFENSIEYTVKGSESVKEFIKAIFLYPMHIKLIYGFGRVVQEFDVFNREKTEAIKKFSECIDGYGYYFN